jgi:hypothetical protein
MTCSSTNLVAVQAAALALLPIAGATGSIIFPYPPPFAVGAILPIASAAVRTRALFWNVTRAMRALDAEWGL